MSRMMVHNIENFGGKLSGQFINNIVIFTAQVLKNTKTYYKSS